MKSGKEGRLLWAACLLAVVSSSRSQTETSTKGQGQPADGSDVDSAGKKPAAGQEEPKSVSALRANASIEEVNELGERTFCSLWPMENIHNYVSQMEDENKVNLFKFRFRFANSSYQPFRQDHGRYYKPFLWYRTRSQHGRTLLMLSFHYDVLSMNILTIGVTDASVDLQDGPSGCYARLSPDGKITLIRTMLLSNMDMSTKTSYGASARDEFVCNQIIMDVHGSAEFKHECCTRDVGGLVCSHDDDDKWITILYFAITALKVLMFLFCPYFLPQNMYSAMYVAAEYVVKLKKEMKLKVFVSEQTDANVRFKHRLTLEDFSQWYRFREFINNAPYDEIIPVNMSELRIKVKGKRVIPENEPPTGLLRTFYDNMCRCKIKQLSAFRDCCETSVYASMEPKFRHKCTWHMCVQAFIKGLLLLVLPIPYYVRLFIYFYYEHEEMSSRREAMDRLGLTERFDIYRTNVIQYFSPFHGIFIATYCFYFLAGLFIGFTSHAFREKLKTVARSALEDMSNVSQTGVLGVIIRTLLYPYRKCGLLAFLLAPFYGVVVTPLCVALFLLYCVPTLYLTHRVPFHARKLASGDVPVEVKTLRFNRMKKLGNRMSRVDKAVHRGASEEEDEEACCWTKGEWTFRGLATVRDALVQFFCSVFCLCILYSVSLIFAESAGLIIEVLAFTMMGIIVNAGSVLKYVSMVLLVFVYMHDCYNNVYENYLVFNKTIIDDMIERTTDDLRKIAAMSSSQQENAAFLVNCVDEADEIQPQLNFEKKVIRWRLGQLLLFLDSFDTPRVPLRLFQKLCQVRVHGAPGPVYISLLAATGKFMIIVIFLMFVMIVVMAFGNVMAMSSTNSTLATLAGGFVPMLLKNVLSSKGTRLSLKSISFKGQVDEIISKYKQYWPVVDLIVDRDIPTEGGDDDNDNNADNNNGSNDSNNPQPSDKAAEDRNGGGADKRKSSVWNKDGGDRRDERNAKANDVHAFVKKKPSDDKAGSEERREKESDKAAGGGDKLKEEAASGADDQVDIFVDLSVADTAGGWDINGSSESLPRPAIMPAYFTVNTNQFYVEPDTANWNESNRTHIV